MSISRITAIAFAFALSAGATLAYAAACAEGAAECGAKAAECGDKVAECSGVTAAAAAACPAMAATCPETAKQTVVQTSTAAAKTEGCGDCVCPDKGAATGTIAQTAAETRSIPGGGVEILPASTDTTTKPVGYKIGDKIEGFTLKHAQTGEMVSLEDLKGEKATVIIFWNNLCPWVEGGPHAAGDRVREMAKAYADKGVSVIGIDPGVDKSEEDLIKYASTQPFPILINRDSSMAARFNAQYTPHTFVLDSNLELQYEGGYDSGARRDEAGNVVHWSRNAVDDILKGGKPQVSNMRGTGCSIKWAPGARPTT